MAARDAAVSWATFLRSVQQVLVLNPSYEPLNVCSVRRAHVLVWKGRAEILESHERPLRSATTNFQRPNVIRLRTYVRVPRAVTRRISRRVLFARDGWHCAYCKGPAETIDHVLPRSRGGRHAWENVVAACAKCNHTKGDRTPAELGWRLHVAPVAPKGLAWRVLGHRAPDPRWADWLDLPVAV